MRNHRRFCKFVTYVCNFCVLFFFYYFIYLFFISEPIFVFIEGDDENRRILAVAPFFSSFGTLCPTDWTLSLSSSAVFRLQVQGAVSCGRMEGLQSHSWVQPTGNHNQVPAAHTKTSLLVWITSLVWCPWQTISINRNQVSHTVKLSSENNRGVTDGDMYGFMF